MSNTIIKNIAFALIKDHFAVTIGVGKRSSLAVSEIEVINRVSMKRVIRSFEKQGFKLEYTSKYETFLMKDNVQVTLYDITKSDGVIDIVIKG